MWTNIIYLRKKLHSRTITRTCCKAKAKDLSFKAKAKAKDLTFKAKAKAKDTKIVLKDSLRTRPRPRTNITEYVSDHRMSSSLVSSRSLSHLMMSFLYTVLCLTVFVFCDYRCFTCNLKCTLLCNFSDNFDNVCMLYFCISTAKLIKYIATVRLALPRCSVSRPCLAPFTV